MKNADWALVISLGILWGMSFVFVELLLAYLSPFMTTGGLASVLNANTAFVTIVLAAALEPYKTLTVNRVVGALIGVVGVTMAIGHHNIFQLYSGNNDKYLIFLATMSYALAGIWAKLKMQSMSPMIAATGMLVMSSLTLTPYAFAFYFDELVSLDPVAIQYALAFALFCSVIAYFLYFKILERTGASNLLTCTVIIPLSSILLNAMLLGQMIALAKMVGLVIIIIGLLVLDGGIINRTLKLNINIDKL